MIEKEPTKIRHALADVVLVKPDFIVINQHKYRLLNNYRDALDVEMLKLKFDPYLEKYDFIIGDVSSEKLRLKGFYRNNSAKINIDKKFETIEDYLYEYLNPGTAFFILESVEPRKTTMSTRFKKPYRERKVKKTVFKGKAIDHEERLKNKAKTPHPRGFVIKSRKNNES